MALQVWLPLDGNLENQGLSDVTVTNSGATVDNNGKIGKCYYFGGQNQITFPSQSWMSMKPANHFSVFCWVKGTTTGWLFAEGGWELLLRPTFARIGLSDNGQYPAKYNYSFDTNTWYHLGFTWSGSTGKLKLYLNGKLVASSDVPSSANFSINNSFKMCHTGGVYLNDIRLYDHALSAKEVKELSKGLILHYPMNINLNQLENAYSNPYFNTSSASGGWNHWGGSGHQGTYGQNTNKEYIFNKNQTYSHWIADASNATKNYLLYQSPAFDGGYRSIQFIIKEENSLPIDETICYPNWNARDGGVPLQLWTSIEYLGDGFYLCKCEGIHQNGSNNLIGVYVTIGHKIYISEAYLENNKELCSYIRPMDFTTVIDCAPAGNTNDGTIVGTITAATDSPRYESSYHFDGASYLKAISPFGEVRTVSLWAKWDSIPSGQSIIFVDYKSYFGLGLYSGGILCGSRSNVKAFSKANLVANTWYHFVIVAPNGGSNAERKLYINGEEQTALTAVSNWSYSIDELQVGKRSNTNDGFKGKISDFRVYCTALSAEDILELYNTAAQVDKDGNVYAYEFKE